ncbi:MAG: TetR/AcrR family transcriptional regulator [Sphingobacteriales bacterium]|nr:MAG: TetR/AcrR family transcriptional regulator [Sphingobacteriales bacterium]
MEPLTKILSAAVDLFRQYSFKTVTMDDIARRAGISKKTLYQHFANKQEVVAETVTWYKCQITEQCSNILKGSQNAVEAMVKVAAMMDEHHKEINPSAMFELQRYFPEAFDTFRQKLLQQDVDMMRDTIQQGINEGFFRHDVNPDIMARFRMETSLMMLQPNLLVNDRHSLLFIMHELAEHFIYGIMTPKGEKLYQKFKEQYLKPELKQVSK